MRPLFAASLEQSLITLVILVVVSALSSWQKKKQQQKQEEAEAAPPPAPLQPRSAPAPVPQSRPRSWEDELRKMLGDETTAAPPLPTLPRPAPAPAPAPAPGPRPRPVIVRRPPPIFPAPAPRRSQPVSEMDRGLYVPPSELAESSQAYLRGQRLDEVTSAQLSKRSSLSEAKSVYERAQALDEKVAQHLGRVVDSRPTIIAPIQSGQLSPAAKQAVDWIRNRNSIRSAILTSIILGPPKSMQ